MKPLTFQFVYKLENANNENRKYAKLKNFRGIENQSYWIFLLETCFNILIAAKYPIIAIGK